ncbi:unnamed protein product [Tetraodon nigroviridis]|uniref:(spotted green pufferfish) hypothetical protein n=1 Tax=Tetraodon nigroviridis TaxID=99883 RepID=Q4TBZ4_TETNG|nr:unnamed protein product [Tetraodon nigroviridis]
MIRFPPRLKAVINKRLLEPQALWRL